METRAAAQTSVHRPAIRHLVHMYEDDEDLGRAAARFLADGVQCDEGLIVIATPQHAALFRSALQRLGVEMDALQDSGSLVLLDAERTLPRLLTGGVPDRLKFQVIIGGVLDGMFATGRFRRLRAYGELVDLLWQAGDLASALRLESYWNDLLQTRSCSLLCGYHLSLLGVERSVEAAAQICDVHSDMTLPEDRKRLEAAVRHACDQVLGRERADDLRHLIAATLERNPNLKSPEKTIFWVRRNLPRHTESILAHARRHYEVLAR